MITKERFTIGNNEFIKYYENRDQFIEGIDKEGFLFGQIELPIVQMNSSKANNYIVKPTEIKKEKMFTVANIPYSNLRANTIYVHTPTEDGEISRHDMTFVTGVIEINSDNPVMMCDLGEQIYLVAREE